MEFRKLIEFGKSSFVVSIPKNWVTENHLSKGDIIHIHESEEGLTLMPEKMKAPPPEEKSIKIDVSGMHMKEIKNQIISHYIQNYREIIIHGPNIKGNLAEIRETIHSLIALEILEETSDKIISKAFLNMQDISIENLIRKMDIITREMLADSKKARNEDVHPNIALRDQDVNRIAYLNFRTIKYLQKNPSLAKEKGMTAEKLLKAWVVSDSIEKVGDQVKRASKLMSRFDKLDDKGWSDLLSLHRKIEEMYNDTLKCYYTQDRKAAYELGLRKIELLKECRTFYEKYWKTEWMPVIIEKYKNMIGVIQPISKTVIN